MWLQQLTSGDCKTVLRPDIAEKGRTVTACLKTEKDNYYIKVPAILEDGETMSQP